MSDERLTAMAKDCVLSTTISSDMYVQNTRIYLLIPSKNTDNEIVQI